VPLMTLAKNFLSCPGFVDADEFPGIHSAFGHD